MSHTRKQSEIELEQPATVNTKLAAQAKLTKDACASVKALNLQITQLGDDFKAQCSLIIALNKKIYELTAIANKPKVLKKEIKVLVTDFSDLDDRMTEIQDGLAAMKAGVIASESSISKHVKELKSIKSGLKRTHCKSTADTECFETACNDYNAAVDLNAEQQSLLFKISQTLNGTQAKDLSVQAGDCQVRITAAKELLAEVPSVKKALQKSDLVNNSFFNEKPTAAKHVATETTDENNTRKSKGCMCFGK